MGMPIDVWIKIQFYEMERPASHVDFSLFMYSFEQLDISRNAVAQEDGEENCNLIV